MENILIVDGSNLLFQMFYGMPARIINAQGRPIQGTLGFMGALLKMIRWVQPTRLAVLFDGECCNERCELDSDYKANREDYSQLPEEETPFSQLPDIYAALDYLGIAHRETTVCETDDWVAGYARQYGHDHRITIASQDSDFFQLITENVQVLRYRGDKSVFCTPDYIQKKLGIAPSQYADYKSLTGDTADNIKGANKVGPKTAAALMQQFGSLENALLRCHEVHKTSVRLSLQTDAERLRKNYKLIKLTGTQPLPFVLEEMPYRYGGETSTQVLKAIGVK